MKFRIFLANIFLPFDYKFNHRSLYCGWEGNVSINVSQETQYSLFGARYIHRRENLSFDSSTYRCLGFGNQHHHDVEMLACETVNIEFPILQPSKLEAVNEFIM